MRRILIVISLTVLSADFALAQIQSSAELVEAMHQRYTGKWYQNLTFEQKTTFYSEGVQTKEETWYEAMKMPEGLVIKIGSMDSGNGLIFRNDSMLVFNEGKLVNSTRRVHDLLVLGFSVYFDSPDVTLKKLEETGYDLNAFEETDEHYVIGEKSSKRAWIEKDRLLFSKTISSLPDGSTAQIVFNKYEKLGKGWIAPEVIFYRGHLMTMKEEYSDISTPKKLESVLQGSFKNINWRKN